MLPGSECGVNSICYLDQCVLINEVDLNIEYDANTLDLTTHCTSGHDANELSASNHDLHHEIECVDWENDFLCAQSCPKPDDSSTTGLYIRHVCCGKCSPKSHPVVQLFSHGRLKSNCSILPLIIFIFL
jgi:hypothetical protein